jgi:hypothetical protein
VLTLENLKKQSGIQKYSSDLSKEGSHIWAGVFYVLSSGIARLAFLWGGFWVWDGNGLVLAIWMCDGCCCVIRKDV